MGPGNPPCFGRSSSCCCCCCCCSLFRFFSWSLLGGSDGEGPARLVFFPPPRVPEVSPRRELSLLRSAWARHGSPATGWGGGTTVSNATPPPNQPRSLCGGDGVLRGRTEERVQGGEEEEEEVNRWIGGGGHRRRDSSGSTWPWCTCAGSCRCCTWSTWWWSPSSAARLTGGRPHRSSFVSSFAWQLRYVAFCQLLHRRRRRLLLLLLLLLRYRYFRFAPAVAEC